ncbi:hypothetical protein ROU88_09645 [Macrococcus capreoli]
MAYTGVSKPYKEQFIEVNINKLNIPDKLPGIERKSLTVGKTKFPCTVEGIKVGYGVRMYFRCEYCGGRVTKLYVNGVSKLILQCRKCVGFNYVCQQSTKTQMDYEAHLLYRYGRMLDPNFKLDTITHTPCPWKPKNMHYTTYEKIKFKYEIAQLKAQKKYIAMVGASMHRMAKHFDVYGINIKDRYDK